LNNAIDHPRPGFWRSPESRLWRSDPQWIGCANAAVGRMRREANGIDIGKEIAY
jgi:hypothetical protein